MVEQGIPGGVVCVSVDGREVWSEGIGMQMLRMLWPAHRTL